MKVIVVTAIILLLGLAGFYYVSSRRDNTPKISEEALSKNDDTSELVIEQLFGKPLPDDAEKTSLFDLTNSDLTAIATRKEDAGVVDFSILADLPEGEEYEVWVGGMPEGVKYMGGMVEVKGGYLFEIQKQGTLKDYNFILVKRGEQKILEGSF